MDAIRNSDVLGIIRDSRPAFAGEILETLVDSYGIMAILAALSDICNEKASHLSQNWQDEETAKLWQRDARTLDRVQLIDALATTRQIVVK